MQYSELQAWLYDANGFCKYHALEYWSKCTTREYIPSTLTAVTRDYLKELLRPILDVDTFHLDKNQFIGYICFYELLERYYKDNNL